MKRSIIFISIFLNCLFVQTGCRKESKIAKSTFQADLIPKKVHGYLDIYFNISLNEDGSQNRELVAMAGFQNKAISVDSIRDLAKTHYPGKVFLDGIELSHANNWNYAFSLDSNFPSFESGLHWTVTGNDTMPGFTYADEKRVPDYFGQNDLPQIFRMAGDIPVQITNFKNANRVEVRVFVDDLGDVILSPARTLQSPGTVHFTRDDFMSYNFPIVAGKVQITLYRENYFTVGDRIYSLRKVVRFTSKPIFFTVG